MGHTSIFLIKISSSFHIISNFKSDWGPSFETSISYLLSFDSSLTLFVFTWWSKMAAKPEVRWNKKRCAFCFGQGLCVILIQRSPSRALGIFHKLQISCIDGSPSVLYIVMHILEKMFCVHFQRGILGREESRETRSRRRSTGSYLGLILHCQITRAL